MNKPMMKCGHVANSTTKDNAPMCVMCDCTELFEETVDLTNRKARCSYFGKYVYSGGKHFQCHSEESSNTNLPFFEYKPDSQYDQYYCGCWGWD